MAGSEGWQNILLMMLEYYPTVPVRKVGRCTRNGLIRALLFLTTRYQVRDSLLTEDFIKILIMDLVIYLQ